jgi:glycosyltransferase involved in cell wall biosynthesis
MNVLIVTDAFPPGAGGSGRSTGALAEALVRRRHRVKVVVSRAKTLGQADWRGIEVSEVQIPASRLGNAGERERVFASGVSEAAGEEAWDLVHAQHWLSAGASRRALPRLPLVVTVRDYWPVCIWSTRISGREVCPGCSFSRRVLCVARTRPALWPVSPVLPPVVGWELRRRVALLAGASAVIAVSGHVARTIPCRARVIPNVVDRSPLTLARPVAHPYVLFVGKLEPGKAPDQLVPILEAASCKLPLLIAGTGRLESQIRAQGGNVQFLGWVEDERALALMQHAEAVLFPSRWQEPLSRVLLDGLAVGAVLVAEPTGGTEEILVDGESGLLGRGIVELGRALARVLEDGALARRLREGALLRARACFSDEVVLPKVEEVYRGVAES